MFDVRRPSGLILTSEHGYDIVRPDIDHGFLEPFRRGAYLPPLGEAADEAAEWNNRRTLLIARCHAAARTLSCHYAFSHLTAAFLHGWPTPIPPVVHVLQTVRAPARRSRDIIRHHTTALPDDDIVEIEGLRVTAAARTAIDCALTCRPPTGLAVVDGALRAMARVDRRDRGPSIERQDVVRAELSQSLETRGSVRHARRAREVLRFSDGLSESGRESWMRWLALSRGMPAPELQVPIPTPLGLRYPDTMWHFDEIPGSRPLLAEYDGRSKYGKNPGAVIAAEKDREDLLKDATGGTFVRFTASALKDPDAAFARLLRSSPLSESDLNPRPELLLPPLPRVRA